MKSNRLFCVSFLLVWFQGAALAADAVPSESEPIKDTIPHSNFDLSTEPEFLRVFLPRPSSESFIKPKVVTLFQADIRFDDNHYSGVGRQESTLIDSRLASRLELTENFSIRGLLRLNKVAASPVSHENQWFTDEGLFLEQLHLNYNTKHLALAAGKFNPNFGNAWMWGRGMWSAELPSEYRQSEKLGLSGSYSVGERKTTGEYIFGYSAFTNDRKNFDNSLITDRDTPSKSQARPGDTRSLSSYVASLDVLFDFGVPKFGDQSAKEHERLTYHFAYTKLALNQRANSDPTLDLGNQTGFVVNGNYKYPIAKNYVLDGLLEYAKIGHSGGKVGVNDKYLNANLEVKMHDHYNLVLATVNHKNVGDKGDGFSQNFYEISLAYAFGKTAFFDNLIFQVGQKYQTTDYRNYQVNADKTISYGALLRYIKQF